MLLGIPVITKITNTVHINYIQGYNLYYKMSTSMLNSHSLIYIVSTYRSYITLIDKMNILNEPSVVALLKSIAQKESIQQYEFNIDKGADKGDGYLSQMTNIQISSKENNRLLNLVIKCAQKDPSQRSTFPTHDLYLREIRFYEKVMPAFEKFQADRHIKKPFNCVPKYYNSCTDNNKEFLIMENIRLDGFELWDRKITLDEEHLLMVMKNYAKLHAVSFAMKEQERQVYEELSMNLDNLFVPKYVDRSFFESFELAAEKASKLFNNTTEKVYAERMKAFKPKIMEFFYLIGQYDWETSVITHGDSWLNNFMFKYSYNMQEKKKKLCDVKIFDFQFMRRVSPILDIGYLVYMNTDAALYNNYEVYLIYYYEQLIKHGKDLGTDITLWYDYETLKKEWKKYGICGLLFGLIGVGILLQDKNNIVDLSDIASGNMSAANIFFVDNNSTEAIRRMRNLVMHFVDNDFI